MLKVFTVGALERLQGVRFVIWVESDKNVWGSGSYRDDDHSSQ